MRRAQLSVSMLEALAGVVLVVGVLLGFGLDVSSPDTREQQLQRYAEDAATILAEEPPRHANTSRLGEIVASQRQFERERSALARRVERLLPANVFYRIETEHGAVGYARPEGVATGEATVATTGGTVTIRVWYG